MKRRDFAIMMGGACLGTSLGSLASPDPIRAFKDKLQGLVGDELLFEAEDVAKEKLDAFLAAQGFYDYVSTIATKPNGNTNIDIAVRFTERADFVYYPVIIASMGNGQ